MHRNMSIGVRCHEKLDKPKCRVTFNQMTYFSLQKRWYLTSMGVLNSANCHLKINFNLPTLHHPFHTSYLVTVALHGTFTCQMTRLFHA